MKKLIIIIGISITIMLFNGCYNDPNYNYQWDIKVTYNNGDIDTISCDRDSFNGNKVILFLSAETGAFSGSGSSCIYMQCGLSKKTITCGVRKYNIIHESKILLKK